MRLLDRRRWASDKGISLIELMLVMLFGALIMAMTLAFFVAVVRSTTQSVDIRKSTADGGNIMNVISTGIRAAVGYRVSGSTVLAPAVMKGSNTQEILIVSFTDAYADPLAVDPDAAPYLLRYYVDSSRRMVEERYKPTLVAGYFQFPVDATGAIVGAPYSKRVLGDLVMNSTTENLFTYYTGPCAADKLTYINASTPILNADRDDVAFIRFNLKIKAFDSQQTVQLDNLVGLPNMGHKTSEVATCPPVP